MLCESSELYWRVILGPKKCVGSDNIKGRFCKELLWAEDTGHALYLPKIRFTKQ